MTLAALVISIAAALAAVSVASGFTSRRLWPVRRRTLVRVHVERTDAGDGAWGRDGTIEGILIGRFAGHYVLTRARWLDAEDASTTLAGDVEIPEARVLFLQRLGGDA